MYSSSKSYNTAKGLIGTVSSVIVTFISCLYGGIYPTRECGLLESGGVVMVDRGFDIQHLLSSKCVTLNIPPFCKEKSSSHLKRK